MGIRAGILIALEARTTVRSENVEAFAKFQAGLPPTVNGVEGRGAFQHIVGWPTSHSGH